MKQELDITKDFDAVLNEARAEWNGLLSRVQIRDNDDSATTYAHITTFYTALYVVFERENVTCITHTHISPFQSLELTLNDSHLDFSSTPMLRL